MGIINLRILLIISIFCLACSFSAGYTVWTDSFDDGNLTSHNWTHITGNWSEIGGGIHCYSPPCRIVQNFSNQIDWSKDWEIFVQPDKLSQQDMLAIVFTNASGNATANDEEVYFFVVADNNGTSSRVFTSSTCGSYDHYGSAFTSISGETHSAWVRYNSSSGNFTIQVTGVSANNTEEYDGSSITCNLKNLKTQIYGTYQMALENKIFQINNIQRLNLTFYDEETGAIINENITLELIGVTNSSIYNVTNGTINFLPTVEDTYIELRYYSDSFSLRSTFLNLLEESYTQNLYLVNSTDPLDVTVRNFGLTGIPNLTVVLQRWYTSEAAWIPVAEEKTSVQGKVRFYIEQGTAYYKLVVMNGIGTVYETNGEKIYDTAYRITTDLNPIYTKFPDLEGSLNFINTSWPYAFTFAYSGASTLISSVCLEVYRDSDSTLLNQTCLSTSSGTLTVTLGENTSQKATIYYVLSGGERKYIEQGFYFVPNDFQREFQSIGLIISIILYIVLVFGMIEIGADGKTVGILALLATDIFFIAAKYLGIMPINNWFLGIWIPGSIVFMYYINKRSL